MTTTHTVPAGTFTTTTTTTPVPTMTTTTTTTTTTDLCFTDIGNNLSAMPRKGIYRSLVLSLNWTIVNLLRRHVTQEDPMAALPEGAGIDAYNDALAALDERRENNDAREEQGFERPVPPIELASHYNILRTYLLAELAQIEINEKFVMGYTPPQRTSIAIGETLRSMLRMSATVDEEFIKREAELTGIDPVHLRMGLMRQNNRDKIELAKATPAILAALDTLHSSEYPSDAEAAFDALPFVHRMRLMAKVLENYDKQASYETVNYTRYQRTEALGNYRMIVGAKNELLHAIHDHLDAHPDECAQYADMMPIFPDRPAA